MGQKFSLRLIAKHFWQAIEANWSRPSGVSSSNLGTSHQTHFKFPMWYV